MSRISSAAFFMEVIQNAFAGRTIRCQAAAICMRSGIEILPYMLPDLQNRQIRMVIPGYDCFYFAKALKNIGGNELNKTMFTRMVGAVFSGNGCYAVYNTRNAVMKWNGMGEFKTLHSSFRQILPSAALKFSTYVSIVCKFCLA